MSDYVPNGPFTTPFILMVPVYEYVKGVKQKTYKESESPEPHFCKFKTYGGTERIVNDVYSIEDTANVETWYDPAIKSNCAIKLLDTGEIYEIISKPENVSMRNQYMLFKVKRIEGGV